MTAALDALDALDALRARLAADPRPRGARTSSVWAEEVVGDPHEHPPDPLLAAMAALREELAGLRGRLAAGEAAPGPAEPATAPVTTWSGVADVIGVSLDTLARRRKAWGVADAKPYFASADAARAWYRRGPLGLAGPRATAAGRKPARAAGTTLADLRARR